MANPSALPPNVSVAHTGEQGRMHAPSAERNRPAITDVLRRHAPQTGRALEIASGTGQHVLAFAQALPGVIWQPSDINSQRRQSIDAWAKDGGANIRPAVLLDAAAPGWAAAHGDQDLIIAINLLHLITAPQARTLITQAALALAPGGRLFLYGPFLRNGQATSAGDAQFHASLQASDPAIGYKDLQDIRQWLADAGLQLAKIVDMPANNLTLISTHNPEAP